MSDLLKNFKKLGVVKLKNFFTDQEINLIAALTFGLEVFTIIEHSLSIIVLFFQTYVE